MASSVPYTLLGRQVLHLLQDLLDHADPRLYRLIVDLLGNADMNTEISVTAIARQWRVSERTVEYHAKIAGFQSVKRILIAAQFIRVWPILCTKEAVYKRYAQPYGYSSYGHLQRHAEQLVQCLPKHLRLGVISTEQAAQRIAAYLRRPVAAAPESADAESESSVSIHETRLDLS